MVDCISDCSPIDTDLPKTLCEFVIVHELVHLLAPNHGKVFKSFMSAYLPDWEERRIHGEMMRQRSTQNATWLRDTSSKS